MTNLSTLCAIWIIVETPVKKKIRKNKSRVQKFGRRHRSLRAVEKPTNDGDLTMIIRKKQQFTISVTFKEIITFVSTRNSSKSS